MTRRGHTSKNRRGIRITECTPHSSDTHMHRQTHARARARTHTTRIRTTLRRTADLHVKQQSEPAPRRQAHLAVRWNRPVRVRVRAHELECMACVRASSSACPVERAHGALLYAYSYTCAPTDPCTRLRACQHTRRVGAGTRVPICTQMKQQGDALRTDMCIHVCV